MPQSRIFQNFLGARRQAEADQRAQQERDLQKQAAAGGVQSQAFQDFAGVNPVAASKLGGILGDIGEDRERSLFQDARKLNNALKADDIPGSLSLIKNRLDMGDKLALESNQPWDPSDTLEMKEKIEAGLISEVIADLDLVEQAGIQSGLIKGDRLTPDQREFRQFKNMEEGPDKQAFGKLIGAISKTATAEERGRIQQVVGDIKTIQDVKRASGKETAKLAVQLKLKPDVQRAVVLAQELAKGEAAKTNSERGNDRALNVYNAAKDGLLGAMSGASTGPALGWLPAITSNQQIADGAVAAMAPVLKQLFRTAGEGNFSDSDQKILMGMVPTRSDTAQARVEKLKLIDTIVMAKLGGDISPTQNVQQPEQQSAPQTATGPNGEKIQLVNGQWVPL
jgi:hypothetical protein